MNTAAYREEDLSRSGGCWYIDWQANPRFSVPDSIDSSVGTLFAVEERRRTRGGRLPAQVHAAASSLLGVSGLLVRRRLGQERRHAVLSQSSWDGPFLGL